MTISPAELDAPICAGAAAHEAGLDVAPAPSELDAVAASIVASRGDEPSPEVDLARAFPLVTAELRWLRGRVAKLTELLEQAQAEARTAGGAADEYPPALPWARLMDAADRVDFLDELAAAAITNADSETALAEVEDACGRWRAIAEAQHAHNTAPGPDPQEPEHPAPCRWPASPDCACAGPVPYALTQQATTALAQPAIGKLRGILAPARKAGA